MTTSLSNRHLLAEEVAVNLGENAFKNQRMSEVSSAANPSQDGNQEKNIEPAMDNDSFRDSSSNESQTTMSVVRSKPNKNEGKKILGMHPLLFTALALATATGIYFGVKAIIKSSKNKNNTTGTPASNAVPPIVKT